MKFSAPKDAILDPLASVVGVLENRHTMPILGNVLLTTKDNRLRIVATDIEVELAAETEVEVAPPDTITVSGRKLHDICKAVPGGVKVELSVAEGKVTVKAARSRFSLASLPAEDFPLVEDIAALREIRVSQSGFRKLLEKTHFSMAHQDVRYYLNGLLLEADGDTLRAVATDGHRLALSELKLDDSLQGSEQVILPRKAVLELRRLLADEGELALTLGTNHLRVQLGSTRLTSKLIDGRFPEYGRVVPTDIGRVVTADSGMLRQALQRVAILSNEKYRGVRLTVKDATATVRANNPEQEEAVEMLEVEYDGADLEIGFNVNYLLDALGAVDGDRVQLGLSDANSSCLISAPTAPHTKFVVMPMRL